MKNFNEPARPRQKERKEKGPGGGKKRTLPLWTKCNNKKYNGN